MKVEYRWQFTYYEQMEMLPLPIFPLIVIDDELLETNDKINEFLENHNLTFEEFTQRVTDGYDGEIEILIQ